MQRYVTDKRIRNEQKAMLAVALLLFVILGALTFNLLDSRPLTNTIKCRDAQIEWAKKNPFMIDGHFEQYEQVDQTVSDVLKTAEQLKEICK